MSVGRLRVKAAADLAETPHDVEEQLLGTCTRGRLTERKSRHD